MAFELTIYPNVRYNSMFPGMKTAYQSIKSSTVWLIIVTLAIGIVICRGRDIPFPNQAHARPATIAERLSERTKFQATSSNTAKPHKHHGKAES